MLGKNSQDLFNFDTDGFKTVKKQNNETNTLSFLHVYSSIGIILTAKNLLLGTASKFGFK